MKGKGKLGKKQARQLCPGLLLAILGTAAVPGFFGFVLRESDRWGKGNVKIEERKIWNAFT